MRVACPCSREARQSKETLVLRLILPVRPRNGDVSARRGGSMPMGASILTFYPMRSPEEGRPRKAVLVETAEVMRSG